MKTFINNILNSQPILIKLSLKLFTCKCLSFQTHLLFDVRFPLTTNEPSTMWEFDKCSLKLCSLLLSLEAPNDVRPVAEQSWEIINRLAKTLIRLRVCAGWSEPLLIAHTTLLEISCLTGILFYRPTPFLQYVENPKNNVYTDRSFSNLTILKDSARKLTVFAISCIEKRELSSLQTTCPHFID